MRYIKVNTSEVPADILNSLDVEIVGDHAYVSDELMSDGYFKVTSVHRDDLRQVGIDANEVTDGQMRDLARKMANDYCEQLFWESLRIIAVECMELPKL